MLTRQQTTQRPPADSGKQQSLRRLLSMAAFCAAAACLWAAAPDSGDRSESDIPHAAESVSFTAAESPTRQLLTRPIQDLRPGMRVLADNPELEGYQPSTDIDPESWRLVRLEMAKADGSRLEIELLRPLEWLVYAAASLPEIEAGWLARPVIAPVGEEWLHELLSNRQIDLDLPEMGASGPAVVTRILPCPKIEADDGTDRRLITGTFRHTAGNVIDLHVDGLDGPIGTTDNHPFCSEDRRAFVPAGELAVGERLRQADGTTTQVAAITPRSVEEAVYNLEVDIDHVYFVGASGVLVHNSYFGFGTREFGNLIHRRVFPDFLKDAFPNTNFRLRLNRGQTGIDGDVLGGNLPFRHVELKPNSDSGFRTFQNQLAGWKRNGEIKGPVGLFYYNAAGEIRFGGLF